MNMQTNQSWERLCEAARQAPAAAAGNSAPLGFSNRMVARWLGGTRPAPGLWELFSLRSALVAAAMMLFCLGINYHVLREQFEADPADAANVITLLAEE